MATERDSCGKFLPGVSGNPAGRRLGSRNKLAYSFIEALEADFEAHGLAAIRKVRTDKPHEYLKVVASLIPRELHFKDTTLDEMTDENITELLDAIRTIRAAGSGKPAANTTASEDDPPASRH